MSMNWKLIEEKPANWEIIQGILQKCNNEENHFEAKKEYSVHWENPRLFGHFMQHLQSKRSLSHLIFKNIFGEELVKECKTEYENSTTVPTQKNKKKGPSMTKLVIQRQNENKTIQKAFEGIAFHPQSIHPIKVNPTIDCLFHLQVVEWCLELFPKYWQKKDKKDNKDNKEKECLDAFLSMERLWEEDIVSCRIIHPLGRLIFEKTRDYVRSFYETSEVRDQAFSILFSHPRLMLSPHSSTRPASVGLYPEQQRFMKKVIQSVIFDKPTLIGDRRPPGTGKTFMAVPLAQKLKALKRGKFVLFTCANELVRLDVARTALLGDNLNLWVGKKSLENGEEVFTLRPHKTCFPVDWKKVYRKEDIDKTGPMEDQFEFYLEATKKPPDIIVADIKTTLEILCVKELRERCIAYIDEVIFDEQFQENIFKILNYLPRQSVLMSSILPSFKDVPLLMQHFQSMYTDATPHDFMEIESKEHACISCAVMDPDGLLVLPHHYQPFENIPLLIERMSRDPLMARLYTPLHVFDLIMNYLPSKIPDMDKSEFWDRFSFSRFFQHIHKVNHMNVRSYVMQFLQYLYDSNNQEIYKTLQEYKPCLYPCTPSTVDRTKMLTQHAYLYQGRTLYVTENEHLTSHLMEASEELLEGSPSIDGIVKERDSKQSLLEKQKNRLQDAKMQRQEYHQEMSSVNETLSSNRLHWPGRYIVNSKQHIERFCPLPVNSKEREAIKVALPLIFHENVEEIFDDRTVRLLLSGVAIYNKRVMTDFQQLTILRNMNKFSFLYSSHELVFGTNVEGLTNLFVDQEFGNQRPRPHLYQLIGRAGRAGHSYEAHVYTNHPQTVEKIMRFDDEDGDIVASSMNDYFK